MSIKILIKNLDQKILNLSFFVIKFITQFCKKHINVDFFWNKWVICLEKVNLLLAQYPDLHKLINEFILFFFSNKNFIFFLLRIYIYLCFFFYLVAWFFIFLGLLTQNYYILWFAKFCWSVYKIWTYPIKKERFLIGKLFSFPIRLVSLFYYFLIYLFNFFKSVISLFNQFIFGNKPGECMGLGNEEEEKNEKNDISDIEMEIIRRNFIIKNSTDSVQRELNCFENKKEKTTAVFKYVNKLRLASLEACERMDNENYHNLSKNWTDSLHSSTKEFWLTMDDINETRPCLNEHEFNKKKKDHDRFGKF